MVRQIASLTRDAALRLAGLILVGLAGSGPALAAWDLNMPTGVTEMSRKIYDLHMLIFWVCVAIGVVVFGAMIYSIVKFRKSQGAVPDTKLAHSTKVEIIWTVDPGGDPGGDGGAGGHARSSTSRTRATPSSPSRSPATSGSGTTTTSMTA